MEHSCILDSNNDIDLFCLLLPRIQMHLNSFHIGWHNLCLQTEHNMTPHQLWVQDLSCLAGETNHLVIEGLSSDEVAMFVYNGCHKQVFVSLIMDCLLWFPTLEVCTHFFTICHF